MPDKHWKAKERFVAKKLKGHRVPQHGEDHSDVESAVFCPEVTVHSIPAWIMERLDRGRRVADKQGKLGMAVVCPRDSSKAYVLIDIDDFEQWYV